jgi:tripartite-type tricarboxylate transporter receptor subunit TctC
VKNIIVAGSTRCEYSAIPTLRESGYPDLVATIWLSISGPARMPSGLVDKLNRAIRAEGSVVQPMTFEQFGRFVDQEIARWKSVVENFDIVGK